MANTPSPWLDAAYRLLSDGQEHIWSDVQYAMLDKITPSDAAATLKRLQQQKGSNFAAGETLDEALVLATREMLKSAAHSMTRYGVVIRDEHGKERRYWEEGDHSRWTAKFRDAGDLSEWTPPPYTGGQHMAAITRSRKFAQDLTDDQAIRQHTEAARYAVWERKLYVPVTYKGEPAAAVFRMFNKRTMQTGYLTERLVLKIVWPIDQEEIQLDDISQMAGWQYRTPITTIRDRYV